MVLKLGGSVITVKDKPMTPRPEAIRRLAWEIAEADVRLILIHGGGSYGHPVASRYGIQGGYRSEDQIRGFAETHQAMVRLNTLIVEALINEGLAAIGVPPSSFVTTTDGRIMEMEIGVLKGMLKMNLTPILHGDVVLDEKRGFTILSGDQLASRLAIELGAERLIYGVDVDGVYTKDPKRGEGKLLGRITPSTLRGLKVDSPTAVDVTGGMKTKIEEAMRAAERGVEVVILNAMREGVILKALRGESIRGSWVVSDADY